MESDSLNCLTTVIMPASNGPSPSFRSLRSIFQRSWTLFFRPLRSCAALHSGSGSGSTDSRIDSWVVAFNLAGNAVVQGKTNPARKAIEMPPSGLQMSKKLRDEMEPIILGVQIKPSMGLLEESNLPEYQKNQGTCFVPIHLSSQASGRDELFLETFR